MTSSVQISEHLPRFLLTSILDEKFVNALPEIKDSFAKHIDKNGMWDKRIDLNKQQHEQLTLVAQRYADACRFISRTKNYELFFRDLSYFMELGGFLLNPSAFLKTIEMLGEPQQAEHWKREVLSGRVIGAYAQTEIGHGSNVQNLETQAHFDSKTQKWRFLSPSSSSSKYWPGLLGVYATHCVLQAQAFVDGKKIGVQTFVVPVRNKDLIPLENVDAGDLGSKIGLNRLDHGYLMLNNCLLPREAMLMKYIKVHPDGRVEGLDNKQALKYGYGSMLNLRVYLASGFGVGTLATTRKHIEYLQASGLINKPQYKNQALRNVCVGLGIILANRQTYKLFREFSQNLAKQNFKVADKMMNTCHIISSTLKAVTSWRYVKIAAYSLTIDNYSTMKSSFQPRIIGDAIPSVTYEGDNSVLLQLTGRYLLKQQPKDLKKPAELKLHCLYNITDNLEYVCEREIERLKSTFGKLIESGQDLQNSWNEDIQREVIEISKIWGYYILIRSINTSVQEVPEELRAFYKSVGLVFANELLLDIKRLSFYGLDAAYRPFENDFTEEDKKLLLDMPDFKQADSDYRLDSDYLRQKGKKISEIIKTKMRPRL